LDVCRHENPFEKLASGDPQRLPTQQVTFCNFFKAHSSAERAALLGGVKVRLLPTDEDYSLRGQTLAEAIAEDKKKVGNTKSTFLTYYFRPIY
jgi:glutamate/tyrosine decarboxylase-like PLP-dependent enzyme